MPSGFDLPEKRLLLEVSAADRSDRDSISESEFLWKPGGRETNLLFPVAPERKRRSDCAPTRHCSLLARPAWQASHTPSASVAVFRPATARPDRSTGGSDRLSLEAEAFRRVASAVSARRRTDG